MKLAPCADAETGDEEDLAEFGRSWDADVVIVSGVLPGSVTGRIVGVGEATAGVFSAVFGALVVGVVGGGGVEGSIMGVKGVLGDSGSDTSVLYLNSGAIFAVIDKALDVL